MKRTIFLQSLLLLFLSNQHLQNYATEIRDAFAGREWEFLQHEITKKYNEKRNCFSNHLKRLASFFAPILIGSSIIAYTQKNIPGEPKLPNYNEPFYEIKKQQYDETRKIIKTLQKETEPAVALTLITAFVSAIAGPIWCDYSQNSNAAFETYEEFIKSWPKNRPFTPESLHQSFDELYMLYQKYGSSSEAYYKKYLAIKDVVSQALYNRFPPPVVIYNSAPVFYYY
jgi:hypothetical protein